MRNRDKKKKIMIEFNYQLCRETGEREMSVA